MKNHYTVEHSLLFLIIFTTSFIVLDSYAETVPRHWEKTDINVFIKADKNVDPDKIELVEDNITTRDGRIRAYGETYYTNWNYVLKNHQMKQHLNLTDDERKADIVIKLKTKRGFEKKIDAKETIEVAGTTSTGPFSFTIKQAEIIIYSINTFDDEETRGVLNHEIGHALGLNHQVCKCIMNRDGVLSQYITMDDVKQLTEIYLK